MPQGTIRWVSERGFGFIRCEDRTDIYFFRPDRRSAPVFLRVGQLVSFQVVKGPRGRHAEQVMLVAGSARASVAPLPAEDPELVKPAAIVVG